MLPPARPVAVPTTTTTASPIGGACILLGWSWKETTGSAGAGLDIYDGTGTGGELVASITLNTNESTRDLFAAWGLEIKTGLFVNVTAGSIKGSVWLVTAERMQGYELVTGERPVWIQQS